MTSTAFMLATLALLAALSIEAWAPTNGGYDVVACRRVAIVLEAAKGEDSKEGAYKFGDLTRSLGRRVTGDKNYKFGDISKKLDQRAKARVSQITGQKEYKFGDLSRWADSEAKVKVSNYTGKAEYQVGDISKEVVRRVWAGDYNLEDVVLMMRVLLQMGASFTPVARLLPVKVLLEILNVGLAQDVGGKVMGGVANTLDERFKAAITGDAKYQLGDKTKEQVSKSLSQFTGKDSYSFGDISQVVAKRLAEAEKDNGKSAASASKTEALDDLLNNQALEEWDRKLVLESKDTKSDSK